MKVETPKPPLTNLQVELLKMFGNNVPEKQLLEIKDMLANYFLQNTIDEATRVSKQKGYTTETFQNWVNEE